MAVGKSEHCVGEPPAEALAVLELFEKLCVVFWPVELSGFHEARRSGEKYSQISGERRAASERFVRHKPMNGSQAVEHVNFNAKNSSRCRAWAGFPSSANGIQPTLATLSAKKDPEVSIRDNFGALMCLCRFVCFERPTRHVLR